MRVTEIVYQCKASVGFLDILRSAILVEIKDFIVILLHVCEKSPMFLVISWEFRGPNGAFVPRPSLFCA